MTLSSIFSEQKPKLHHVWVGSRIEQKELDYAQLWEQANPQSKQYIWVDQYALLVDDVKREIIAWAEHEALVQLDISSKDDLMARMVKDNALNSDNSSAYFQLVTRLASEKRYVLDERLSKLDRQDQEIARLEFATEMHEALHGAKAAADYKATLMRRWGADFEFTAHGIQAGKLRDISELANFKKNKKLFAAYLQELNLRQNMAAASDIFRVIALKEKGGYYADLDLLPLSDGISKIQTALGAQGFQMLEDQGRIRAAITDALITALKCIDGYQSGALHELEARDYFKTRDAGEGAYTDEQLNELKAVNSNRKSMIDLAVADYLAGRSKQESRAIFNALPSLKRVGFEGLGVGVSPKGGVINAFIAAKNGNALIVEVAKKIAANYDFMKSIEGLMKASALATSDAQIGALSEQIYTTLQHDYPDLVGAQLEGQFLRAMQSYMADGIEPGSLATVSISGPSVFLNVLLSKFDVDGTGVDERVVAENAGIHDYSLDAADERASNWSNGDGTTRIAEIGDRNFLAKDLHHVWLGSALRQKESGYAKLWATQNPDYDSTIWFDAGALAVNATKREIERYAEKAAANELGIKDAQQFSDVMSNRRSASEFIDAKVKFSSRARFELNALLSEDPNGDHDGIRIGFIYELRRQTDGSAQADLFKARLLNDLTRDRLVMQSQAHLRDVHDVLNLPGNTALKRAYELEVNLRQNMAAASDIVRVAILKQLGGVYVDFDILPQFGVSFETIKDKLRARGYEMPAEMSSSNEMLRTSITDAMLSELGVIENYDANAASHPIVGGEWTDDPLKIESSRSKHESILRETVKEVIAQAGASGGVFQPLRQITPIVGGFMTGDGIRQIGNYFMASKADGEIISRLAQEIAKRYEFLLDAEVFGKIEKISTGDDAGSWTFETELAERFKALGAGTDNQASDIKRYLGVLRDYMADGISPQAQSTVKLSGPMVLIDVLNEYLGLDPRQSKSDAFTSFLTDASNRHTSDSGVSSWVANGLDAVVEEIKNRLFSSREVDPSLTHPGDGMGSAQWSEPKLIGSDAGAGHSDSFHYDHQAIIQIDHDNVAQAAAQALYGKHPGKSTFVQWREDGAHFFESGTDGAVVQTASPFGNWHDDNALRLTFVGHGTTRDGEFGFGGKTSAQFLEVLSGLLKDVGGNIDRRVVINLVACGLEDLSLQAHETYAGQVAQGLLEHVKQAGLSPEHVVLRARQGDVSVDPSGSKSTSGIQYEYKPSEGHFVRMADVSGEGRLTDTKPYDQTKPHVGILGDGPAQLRSAHEAIMLQLQKDVALGSERNAKVPTLDFPGDDFKLVPELVRDAQGGGYEVGFAKSPITDEVGDASRIKWVHTDEDVFMRWKKRAQALGAKVGAGVHRVADAANGIGRYLFASDVEGSAAHTITSAFLLQALIGPQGAILVGNKQSALEALSGRKLADLSADEIAVLERRLTYLRVQQGVNYAALTSGLVNDGAELAKLFSILKDTNTGATSGLTKGLAKVGGALGGLGVLFDVGSVVFAGIELANAQTERERSEALINLGLNMVSTGMEVGSITVGALAGEAGTATAGAMPTVAGAAAGTAEAAGASTAGTVAGVLGGLGVIVSGLSIGIGTLVHTIHEERDKMDHDLWKLEDYLASVVDVAPAVDVSALEKSVSALNAVYERALKVVGHASGLGGFFDLITSVGGLIATAVDANAAALALAFNTAKDTLDETKAIAQQARASHQYGPLQTVSPGVFKFHDSLAATEFDMNTGALTYADVRIAALEHSINVNVPGITDKYLSMLAPFIKGDGLTKMLDASGFSSDSVLVLPHMTGVDFQYQLRTYGYSNLDQEFPLLKALEDATEDHEFYLWGSGGLTVNSYAPGFFVPTYRDTTFRLILNDKQHVIVVPTVDRSQVEVTSHLPVSPSKMAYALVGGGGTYTVSLPAIRTDVKIDSTFASTERWTINVSNAVYGLERDAKATPRTLPKGFFDSTAVSRTGITLDGKTVLSIEGDAKRNQISVLVSLDSTEKHHLVWMLGADESASGATGPGVGNANRWDTRLNEHDALLLRVGKREEISRTLLTELASQIRDAGVHRRFLSFGTADGCMGELDLSTGAYTLSDHDDATGLTHLYVDGVSVRQEKLAGAFVLNHFELGEVMGTVATQKLDDEHVLSLYYAGAHLVDEQFVVSDAVFKNYTVAPPEDSDDPLAPKGALDMDLDSASVRNKRVSVLTAGEVDLSVDGKDVTLDVDGPDLAFFVPGRSMLRWLSAQPKTTTAHTLNLGDGPESVEAALTHHDRQRESHVWAGPARTPVDVRCEGDECLLVAGNVLQAFGQEKKMQGTLHTWLRKHSGQSNVRLVSAQPQSELRFSADGEVFNLADFVQSQYVADQASLVPARPTVDRVEVAMEPSSPENPDASSTVETNPSWFEGARRLSEVLNVYPHENAIGALTESKAGVITQSALAVLG